MHIIIRPSAIIRQNYNTISNLCRETQEPVFLTKNGVGDLVVMDINTFNRRERQLETREQLVEAEELRLMGVRDIQADAVCEKLSNITRQKYTSREPTEDKARFRVEFAPDALYRLENRTLQQLEDEGKTAAHVFLDRLEACIVVLKENPISGGIHMKGLPKRYRIIDVYAGLFLIYQVDEEAKCVKIDGMIENRTEISN